MANCGEMKKGDVFVCKICGLELPGRKKMHLWIRFHPILYCGSSVLQGGYEKEMISGHQLSSPESAKAGQKRLRL